MALEELSTSIDEAKNCYASIRINRLTTFILLVRRVELGCSFRKGLSLGNGLEEFISKTLGVRMYVPYDKYDLYD